MTAVTRYRRDIVSKALVRELKPLIKAYALGYASLVVPRLPAVLDTTFDRALSSKQRLSCAVIIGGSTLLPRLLRRLVWFLISKADYVTKYRVATVLRRVLFPLSSFVSAWLAFNLLNRDDNWSCRRAVLSTARSPLWSHRQRSNQLHLPPSTFTPVGKTMDLSLFAFCRAVDAVITCVWHDGRHRRLHPEVFSPFTARFLRSLIDPMVFANSSAVVMWAWFYAPERLPRTYSRWISKIAQIDDRLLKALRLCRQGDFVYGWSDSDDAELPSLCKELNMPGELGNPVVTIPVPCELYHCGSGKSCEIHAIKRFRRAFVSAIRVYLPLQLFSFLRRPTLTSRRLTSLLKGATRSSAFLAAFVSLFYYAVCLRRTRLGPRFLPSLSPQRWDSGLCVLAGCLACGWSIMIEKTDRQQEIALFIAPRALSTVLPRVYDKRYQRREHLVFACSTAIVMTMAQYRKEQVRGLLGGLLASIMKV